MDEIEGQERLATYINVEHFFPKPYKTQKIIWETKDGRRLEIKDMTTLHIQNSLAKCIRDNWRLPAIPYFKAELKRRQNDQ